MQYLIWILLFGACGATDAPCPTFLVENQPSPAWQVPVHVSAGDTILDYGVVESDTITRDVIVRLVAATSIGPDVLHGPVTLTIPVGEANEAAGMALSQSAPHAPLLIQVWRPDIAPVNNGRLVAVWVSTAERGTQYFSAIAGNGNGETTYMQPLVDWYEPG